MAGRGPRDTVRFHPATTDPVRCNLLGGGRSRLVMTHHHILLDGWSTPVLVQELFFLYGEAGDDRLLPRPVPYRDYLAWLTAQDGAAAGRGVARGAGGGR